jgi:hypothetical protein
MVVKALVLFLYVNLSFSIANLTLTNYIGVVTVSDETPAKAPQKKRTTCCRKDPSFL